MKPCRYSKSKGLKGKFKGKWNQDPHERAATRRAVIARWKERKGCSCCGDKTLRGFQMDLDHRDPANKEFGLGRRDKLGALAWITIKEELAKCDILCKNCHALKTHNNNDLSFRR